MIRSLYLSATNMVVQRKKMDVVTNNLANVETTGYRADSLVSRSFDDMLLRRVGDPAVLNRSPQVGPLNTGVRIDEVITSFDEGSFEQTGRDTDVAIAGDGFFVISTANGDRYTRDGTFSVDREGYLVNAQGLRVMGESGTITIPASAQSIAIDGQGNIKTQDGTAVGTLRVVQFENNQGLRKAGNNLYINYENMAANPAENAEVLQGYAESSNVEPATEMVNMLQLYRSYETSQRMVRMVDETLAKTVNEVGRVKG